MPLLKTLYGKVVLLACLLTLMTALVVGGVSYVRITDLAINRAVDGLAGESRLMALLFKDSFDRMRNDAQVLRDTPPIPGIIRAIGNQSTDIEDTSTLEQWRTRLETIFTSVLRERPAYTQLRYIGLADGGRELVRVDQNDDGIRSIAPDALQQKAREPYFVASLNLRPDGYYFSEVTYNREQGKVDPRLIPTLRLVLPIYADGKLFGFLVINADYAKMMRHAVETIMPTRHITIFNHTGDYVEYDPETGYSELELADYSTRPPPAIIASALSQGTDEFLQHQNGLYSYFVRLVIDPNNPQSFLGVALTVPETDMLAEATSIQRTTLLLGAVLVFVAVVVAAWAMTVLLRPMKRMTAEIASAPADEALEGLPVERGDEIGSLARAFTMLSRRLSESRERLAATVRGAIDGFITIDADGQVRDFNPAAETMFGYSRAEVAGQSVSMLMPDDGESERDWHDWFIEGVGSGLPQPKGKVREVEGKRKSGARFPIDLSISSFEMDGQRMYGGVLRDISDRKRAERDLERLMRNLERSNADLEDFAHIASHDLREPLRAINNHAKFMLEDYPDVLDEQGVKRLNRLMFLTERMEHLVADLLHYSRLGNEEQATQPTDLNAVVADVLGTLEDGLREKKATVKVVSALPTIACNRTRVGEVFRNLIVNAVKYNSSAKKKVEIGCLDEAGGPVLFVRDNGRGIPREHYTDIFRIFKRLELPDSDRQEGTGSGLTFVKRIVERHGGRIWLESEVGKGTTFFFTLVEGDRT